MAVSRYQVRDVEDDTKARIAAWAKRHRIPVGQALAKIMDIVEKVEAAK